MDKNNLSILLGSVGLSVGLVGSFKEKIATIVDKKNGFLRDKKNVIHLLFVLLSIASAIVTLIALDKKLNPSYASDDQNSDIDYYDDFT